MKYYILSLIILWPLLTIAQVNYIANTEKSQIIWTAYKVTGQHDGFIKLSKGTLVLNKGKIVSGNFTIDMNSITCNDISDYETNATLVGHLKSNDFFGAKKYPESKLELNKVIEKNDTLYEGQGILTIKGISHPLRFNFVYREKQGILVAIANITIDRTLYNIRYGSGKFFESLGDKTIYDNFDLQIKLITEIENSASLE